MTQELGVGNFNILLEKKSSLLETSLRRYETKYFGGKEYGGNLDVIRGTDSRLR
jgi:hypothetical protein